MRSLWRRVKDWLRWVLPIEQCAECGRWIKTGSVLCDDCIDRGR